MQSSSRFPFKAVGHAGPALESRVDELCGRLSLIPPTLLAEQTGAAWLEIGQGRGEFHLSLFDTPLILTYPGFAAVTTSDDHLPAIKHALLVYYFLTSDGAPPADNWISFADLPDGRVYSSAFQGYTGDELAKAFLLDLTAFKAACEKFGGVSAPLGDAAYRFRALPRLDLLVVYHLGDEDFTSTCKILFDSNVGHYLPTEACAVLGSMLAQKILRMKSWKPGFSKNLVSMVMPMNREPYFTPETIQQKSRTMLESLASFRARHADSIFRPGRVALLVLDMQDYFLREGSHAFVPSALAILSNIQNLIALFHAHDRPVVFTRHINTNADARMMSRWWRDLIRADSPDSAITASFDTSKGIVIQKSQYDAFYKSSLEEALRGRGVEQVVVTGVMTHLCCETTARSAFVRGFEVFFCVDGTATYTEEFHRAALLNLAHGFVSPVACREIELK